MAGRIARNRGIWRSFVPHGIVRGITPRLLQKHKADSPGTQVVASAPQAYSQRSLVNLLRNMLILYLCRIPIIVRNASRLFKILENICGKNITYNVLVRRTFFNHFCAGRDVPELEVTVLALKANGIGAILDYAVEDDMPEETQKFMKRIISKAKAKRITVSPNIDKPPPVAPPVEAVEESSLTLPVAADETQSSALILDQDRESAVSPKPSAEVFVMPPSEPETPAANLAYLGEPSCEANAKIVMDSIHHAAHTRQLSTKRDETAVIPDAAFAACKMTALCHPNVLKQVTRLVWAVRKLWCVYMSDNEELAAEPLEHFRFLASLPENRPSLNRDSFREGVRRLQEFLYEEGDDDVGPMPLNPLLAGHATPEAAELHAALTDWKLGDLDDDEMDNVADKAFDFLRGDNDTVDYLDFTRGLGPEMFMAPELLGDVKLQEAQLALGIFTMSDALPRLNRHDTELFGFALVRAQRLAKLAHELDVMLMVDAEQTYFQGAIDYITLSLQRTFNRPMEGRRSGPTILGTYQAYLTHTNDKLLNDLARSTREGWHWGGKLVRGAYLIQERELAAKFKYMSPIFSTKNDTDNCYNTCARSIIAQKLRGSAPGTVAAVIASHNELTVVKVIDYMASLNICKETGGVYFAQLLGMADYVSFPLGHAGYSVFKYCPYGPVGEVMPYLVRRAQENSGGMPGADREMSLLWGEVRRRIFPGFRKS